MNLHEVSGYPSRKSFDESLDDTALRTMAFVVFCAKMVLGLSDEEAIEILTEGAKRVEKAVQAIWALFRLSLRESPT